MARVLKPPAPLPAELGPSMFLAGSIEMGRAADWQLQVEQALAHYPVTVLNPRREAWDASWAQDLSNPQFVGQVEWELAAQEHLVAEEDRAEEVA